VFDVSCESLGGEFEPFGHGQMGWVQAVQRHRSSRAENEATLSACALAGLHNISIAAATAAGRPAVVVSTPTFCVSRWCGPITDSVNELAGSVIAWPSFTPRYCRTSRPMC